MTLMTASHPETAPTPPGTAFLEVERSITGRRWQMRAAGAQVMEGLRRSGIGLVEARLLAGRGVTEPDEAARLLAPRLKDQMPDPFVLADMEAAVEAILDAVLSGSRIVILADYDVDGGTSGAILLAWLAAMGADAGVFVPDRLKDGYGPSPAIMRRIQAEGADLLITVDCGAAAHEALGEAARIGLGVVVFDHHLMQGAPPPALAVVNPNRADDTSGLGHLTAAGVAFLAAAALNRAARNTELAAAAAGFNLLEHLDLAALGTVCDVAPLTGLNRVLVAQGLKVLERGERVGLAALQASAQLKKAGTTYAAGWVLGPRLNAGGRIGDSSLAVRLLSTRDADEAGELAALLETLNAERRAIEAQVLDEAEAMARAADPEGQQPLVLVGKPGWHPGVVGIVAGRLKEKFGRPAIVLGSADADDPVAKGSGRSVAGVNLGACIAAAVAAGVLEAGGGHAMAAGMTSRFDALERVREDLAARLAPEVAASSGQQGLKLDGFIGLGAAGLALVEAQERVGPYGPGWAEPVFAVADVRPFAVTPMRGGHLRVSLEDRDGVKLRAAAFRAERTPLGDALSDPRQRLHVVLKVKRDDWKGGDGADAEIVDAAPAQQL
jgi:single-stranded-DNA-specific exonuclease